jgi:hypothetical protein
MRQCNLEGRAKEKMVINTTSVVSGVYTLEVTGPDGHTQVKQIVVVK